jgi:hypothetical protein
MERKKKKNNNNNLLIYVVFRATLHECLSVSNISELSSRRFSELLLFYDSDDYDVEEDDFEDDKEGVAEMLLRPDRATSTGYLLASGSFDKVKQLRRQGQALGRGHGAALKTTLQGHRLHLERRLQSLRLHHRLWQ